MSTDNSKALAWWHGATIYQIYPRSFFDSSGNGIGDLNGIRQKLPYIRDLGVDAIWISPFFTSPMKDFGYDVADFCDVDPTFGTLKDFDLLIEAADFLNIKVIIDQVYSHSSDQHPWFIESARDKVNDKADWYVWADAKEDAEQGRREPSNWQSIFGGSCWQWSDQRQQYYLHNFLKEQPDINLHNPDVQDAILDVARFWLDRGVKGFRLDALHCAMHDLLLRDNPVKEDVSPEEVTSYYMQDHIYDHSHPDVSKFLERFRKLMDEYEGIFTVAEVGAQDPLPVMKEYTEPGRLNSAYSFDFLSAGKPEPKHIRQTVSAWQNHPEEGWPSWAFSNHDAPRVASRWGGENHPAQQSKLIALLQFSLRGNSFLYQGEELGLPQADVAFEELQDPEAIANWPNTMGRDGSRTPMPWVKDQPHAGFSINAPWMSVDEKHAQLAVDGQINQQGSILEFFKQAITFKKAHIALRSGDLIFLENEADLLVYKRQYQEDVFLCAFNLSDSTKILDISLPQNWLDSLVVGIPKPDASQQKIELPPWSGFVTKCA